MNIFDEISANLSANIEALSEKYKIDLSGLQKLLNPDSIPERHPESRMLRSTLCYLEEEGKFYMLHRTKKENDPNRDKWIGIGGHFQKDEDPYDCVKREALEETGLELTNLRYVGLITFLNTQCESEEMHLFHCTKWEKRTDVSCEEGDLEWIEKEHLLSLPMWQGDRIFLDLMEENVPFFSLKLNYEGNKLLSAQLNGKQCYGN